jgi:hypothetical protein
VTETQQTETITTKTRGESGEKATLTAPGVFLADEKPADHPALALLKSQPVTEPQEAAALFAHLGAALIDALPAAPSRRLADLVHAVDPSRYAGSVKAREAADHRKEAARLRVLADRATSQAQALDDVDAEEYAVQLLAKEARAAKEAGERIADREGAITVTHYSPYGDESMDVTVKPSELRKAGYHHHTRCGAGGFTPVPLDHDLVRGVWQALLDHHDQAHGLTSWTNCPDPACKAIPEGFRKEPWDRINVLNDEDWD